MTGYARKFEGNTTVSFKISDKQLLKKYNQIWKRADKLLKIEFDSEPVYGDNDKYIKTKIKIDDGTMVTNFQSKKMPREPCKCLSIIMKDSVTKTKKKYYPQHSWKNANMNKKRQKWRTLLMMFSIEKSSSDESDSESDNDNNNDRDNDACKE